MVTVHPARSAILRATIVGIVHVSIVKGHLPRFDYPAFETIPRMAVIPLAGAVSSGLVSPIEVFPSSSRPS